MLKRTVFLILTIIIVFSFASCDDSINGDNHLSTSDNGVIPPHTEIANEFALRLPDFKFSSSPIENYDEALKFSFNVNCTRKEYESYLEAVKKAGFTMGYPEQTPVTGNGYYKASDSEKYMIEMVYMNDRLTVVVTRP